MTRKLRIATFQGFKTKMLKTLGGFHEFRCYYKRNVCIVKKSDVMIWFMFCLPIMNDMTLLWWLHCLFSRTPQNNIYGDFVYRDFVFVSPNDMVQTTSISITINKQIVSVKIRREKGLLSIIRTPGFLINQNL